MYSRAEYCFKGRSWSAWLGLLLLVAVTVACQPAEETPRSSDTRTSGIAAVETAYQQGLSGVMVDVAGQVDRILPDDTKGSRHQRFILRLDSGHTLLISHNIDIAERVPVSSAETMTLRGQYEWNEKGGVVHWTHHDPQGQREGGWIRVGEVIYR